MREQKTLPGQLSHDEKHAILIRNLISRERETAEALEIPVWRRPPKLLYDVKDRVLSGVYVRRCRCGRRPWHDRIFGCTTHTNERYWLHCCCGLKTDEYKELVDAVEAWNQQKVIAGHEKH